MKDKKPKSLRETLTPEEVMLLVSREKARYQSFAGDRRAFCILDDGQMYHKSKMEDKYYRIGRMEGR